MNLTPTILFLKINLKQEKIKITIIDDWFLNSHNKNPKLSKPQKPFQLYRQQTDTYQNIQILYFFANQTPMLLGLY